MQFKSMILFCVMFLAIIAKAQNAYTLEDNRVMVNNKLYCLYDEPKSGSKSFIISNPEGEVLIQGDVKQMQANVDDHDVESRFEILFTPNYKQLSFTYSKDLGKEFLEAFIKHNVLQDGFWNEEGADRLYAEWSTRHDAVNAFEKGSYLEKKDLVGKIGEYHVKITGDRYVVVNDTVVFKYTWHNNWRHRNSNNHILGKWYTEIYLVYDLADNLVAQIGVNPNRSQDTKNIALVTLPEQELFFFRDIYRCKEEKIISTAIKVLLIRKAEKT